MSDKNSWKSFVEVERNDDTQSGKPTTISYNLPEPTAINGRTFIEIIFDNKIKIFRTDTENFVSLKSKQTFSKLKSLVPIFNIGDIITSMKNGFDNPLIFPHVGNYAGLIRLKQITEIPTDPETVVHLSDIEFEVIGKVPISNELAKLHPIDVYSALSRKRSLLIFKSTQGLLTYTFVDLLEKKDNPSLLFHVPNIEKFTNDVQGFSNDVQEVSNDVQGFSSSGLLSISNPENGHPLEGRKPDGVKFSIKGTVTYRHYFDSRERDQYQPPRMTLTHNWQPTPLRVTPPAVTPNNAYDFEVEVERFTESFTYELTVTALFPEMQIQTPEGPVRWVELKDVVQITVPITIQDAIPVDTNPPDLNIESPEDEQTFNSWGNLTLDVNGTASDAESGIKIVLVDIGDGFQSANPVAPNDWSHWSYQGTTSKFGKLQINVRAIDNGDNLRDLSKTINIIQIPKPYRLRLYLIESYNLSSYLGQYGAGRVIKTFSLLPGEKTKISVKTYSKTQSEVKQSSSILDSVTDESTKDFENTLEQEQSDKEAFKETFSYEVNAKAEGSWGVGRASVSGGIKGGTDSARETFAKNVINATQKHASKASAKRDVTINSSYEKKEEIGTEDQIEREIQNINVGRTLNFVFRQMNQQIVTILHLIDARVAVWDGDPNPDTSIHKEYTLSELDGLFRDFIVDDEVVRKTVIEAIEEGLKGIIPLVAPDNKKGKNKPDNGSKKEEIVKPIDFVIRRELPNGKYYLQVKKYTTTYIIDETGTEFAVPGIIIAAESTVMRTDGVLVEALLGQSNALDNYSQKLQNAAVKLKELENDIKDVEKERDELAVNIVDEKDEAKAGLFEKVFPCCKPTIFSLWPRKENEGDNST